jgi:site-specific recombinase XerD
MTEFITYLQQKGFRQNTQKQIMRIANDFFCTSGAEAISTTKKDVLKYLEHLKKAGKQNTTINISLRALKYYFAFLLEDGIITTNPTNFIKIRGVKRRKLHQIFTAEELTQLADDYYNLFIKNFDDRKIKKNLRQYSFLGSQRNYCMLTFLIYQGLHTDELEKITLDDIDLFKATVRIAANNRTNARTLHLNATQTGVLMQYIQNTRLELLQHYTEETNRLFLLSSKCNGKRKAYEKHSNSFNHLKTQLQSINTDITNLRQLRASVITGWIQTVGLRKAQYMAGHRYTSSTENYLPNDIEQLSDDIEKYNPF